MIEQIQWKTTCCAWHGEYAEHISPNGDVLRLKRGPDVDGYLVMVFKNNQCLTLDEEGAPSYKTINEKELIELITK